MGVTGSGKTTFTSVASDRKDLGIGDGLDPCTQDPQAVHLTVNGRPVVLIDTPGFDDNLRSDVEILEDIAKWLSKQGYTKQQPLDGLILLHPITQDFDSNLERRRTRILEKILGKDAYKRVVVATTMWGCIVNESEVEKDLRFRWEEPGGVWEDFRQGGATLTKHQNNRGSAERIIRSIIDRSDKAGKVGFLLQEELGGKSLRFTETSLGKELETILDNDIRFIQEQLLEHRNDRPPESYRKSRNHQERQKWREWEDDYHDLTKNLELRHMQVKRLNSFIVSSVQMSRIFSLNIGTCQS